MKEQKQEEQVEQAEQQTQVIDMEATQITGPDVFDVDMIEGEPIGIGETEIMDPAILDANPNDAAENQCETEAEDGSPTPKRKKKVAIATVAAAALVALIAGGVAMANPFVNSGQPQPEKTAAASSSSSSSTSKAPKSNSSSSSVAIEEKGDDQPTADDQQAEPQQQAETSSRQEGDRPASSDNGNKSSEPQKHWVDEKGHYEKRLVKEAYDEPIYEKQAYDVCTRCGADITGHVSEHLHKHIDRGENCGNGTAYKTIQVDTIHHDAVYEQVYVVDTPGHWE